MELRASSSSMESRHPPPGFATDRVLVRPAQGEIPLAFVLSDRTDGRLLGEARFSGNDGVVPGVEMDLVLARRGAYAGMIWEGLVPVFRYVFDHYGAPLIRWCPALSPSFSEDPSEAHRSAKNLGMVPETLVTQGTPDDGPGRDRLWYALTQDRWREFAELRSIPEEIREKVPQDLWAVTCFFNPAAYRSHRAKYSVFRERIGVPLMAVELAYGDEFELGPGDAERLLRLGSDQVLWQKERLLNLAVQALPEEARIVVWVDADVVFEREDWPQRTREALESHSLVQPYARIHDLPPGANLGPASLPLALVTRPSLGKVCMGGGYDPGRTMMDMMDVGSPGHAWAMRRDPLEEVGLYDAMILGSGDNAVAQAALGHADVYAAEHEMNPQQERHYKAWAHRFHSVVCGEIGFVPGDLYHFWHGDLSRRGYSVRYPGFAPFGFDPFRDIELDEQGAWRWATEKPDMHKYVADYFDSRREDG